MSPPPLKVLALPSLMILTAPSSQGPVYTAYDFEFKPEEISSLLKNHNCSHPSYQYYMLTIVNFN